MKSALLAIVLLAFFTLGCGPLEDAEISWIGNEPESYSAPTETDSQVESQPRDPRLAEGEIYRVVLNYGAALSDGGFYEVRIENPRNNWRDLCRWDASGFVYDAEQSSYFTYEAVFKSDNFNVQDPAQMDGEYELVVVNGFGYEKRVNLTWKDGQFTDGGYVEYSVP